MADLTTYIKDTEAGILATVTGGDGKMAFSTDTGKFFLSEGTNWVEWKSTREYGNYALGGSEISVRPLYHLDPSSTAHVKDTGGSVPVQDEGVASLTCKASGRVLTQTTGSNQPTYLVDATTPPIAGTGDGRINSLNTLQFNTQEYLAHDHNGSQEGSRESHGYTGMAVIRLTEGPSGNTAGRLGLLGPHEEGSRLSTAFDLYFDDDVDPPQWNFLGGGLANVWQAAGTANGLYTASATIDDGDPVLIHWCVSSGPETDRAVIANCTTGGTHSWFRQSTLGTNVTRSLIRLPGLALGRAARWDTATYRFQGEVGEVLIWNSVVSHADLNTAGAYLATKWGTGTDVQWTDL